MIVGVTGIVRVARGLTIMSAVIVVGFGRKIALITVTPHIAKLAFLTFISFVTVAGKFTILTMLSAMTMGCIVGLVFRIGLVLTLGIFTGGQHMI